MRTLNYLFILISFVMSSICLSEEVVVVDKRLKYTLSYNKDLIKFDSPDAKLSMVTKDCNRHINTRFLKEANKIFSEPMLKDFRSEFIEVRLNGSVGFLARESKRAYYLLSMLEEIKKIKIEEMYNCEKKAP